METFWSLFYLLGQALPETLSSFSVRRTSHFCLIQFDLYFLFLKICSLADGIINDTITQRLWENTLFIYFIWGNDLVGEMGCFFI